MLFGCKLSIGGVGGRNHVKRVVFCIFFYSDERQATCCNAMQDVRYSFHFVKTNGQPRVNLTFPFYAIVAFDVCLLATHTSSFNSATLLYCVFQRKLDDLRQACIKRCNVSSSCSDI